MVERRSRARLMGAWRMERRRRGEVKRGEVRPRARARAGNEGESCATIQPEASTAYVMAALRCTARRRRWWFVGTGKAGG